MTVKVYINSNNTFISGFSKAVIENIVKIHNSKSTEILTIIYNETETFNELFNVLLENTSDSICAVSSISITEERLKKYDFSHSYFPVGQAIITADSKELTESDWKIKVRKLGGSSSGMHFSTAKRLSDKYKFEAVDIDSKQNYHTLIQNGVIDAYVGDSNMAWFAPNRKIVTYIKDAPITHYGIMYPKGSKLKAKLDPIIKYFTRSKVYYNLVRTHLKKDANHYFREINHKY